MRIKQIVIASLSTALDAASLVLVSPQPAVAEKRCLEAGSDQSVVEGRLGLQEGLGPAAFIVVLPAGLCLTGRDAHDRIDQAHSVQLYATSADGFQELYGMVGERVYVRGRASGQRTFQQRAPILLEVIEIATR